MLKFCILYLILLELAQILTTIILCLCFLCAKYIGRVKDETWKDMLVHMTYRKLIFIMFVIEIGALFMMVPFSFWWFELWKFTQVNVVSISVLMISIGIWIGKVCAIKNYVSKQKQKEKKRYNQSIYK